AIERELAGMKRGLDRAALAKPEIPIRGEQALAEGEAGRGGPGGACEAWVVAGQDPPPAPPGGGDADREAAGVGLRGASLLLASAIEPEDVVARVECRAMEPLQPATCSRMLPAHGAVSTSREAG